MIMASRLLYGMSGEGVVPKPFGNRQCLALGLVMWVVNALVVKGQEPSTETP